jgi:hypothetical protein
MKSVGSFLSRVQYKNVGKALAHATRNHERKKGMLKSVVIPTADVVDDFVNDETSPTVKTDDEKQAFLHEAVEGVDKRFNEFFSLFFTLFNRYEPNGIPDLENKKAAHEDLRKIWRVKRFVSSFTNLPKEIEVEKGKKVYEKIVSIASLTIDKDKFTFEIDNTSLAQMVGLLEDVIKEPAKHRTKEGEPMIRGTWVATHLDALKRATEVVVESTL